MFALNEDIICIYADLDRLIANARLSDQERMTVDYLMKGYTLRDIANHYGKARQHLEILMNRAVKKIVKRNDFEWHEWVDAWIGNGGQEQNG